LTINVLQREIMLEHSSKNFRFYFPLKARFLIGSAKVKVVVLSAKFFCKKFKLFSGLILMKLVKNCVLFSKADGKDKRQLVAAKINLKDLLLILA